LFALQYNNYVTLQSKTRHNNVRNYKYCRRAYEITHVNGDPDFERSLCVEVGQHLKVGSPSTMKHCEILVPVTAIGLYVLGNIPRIVSLVYNGNKNVVIDLHTETICKREAIMSNTK
jgi:hypothetical protein